MDIGWEWPSVWGMSIITGRGDLGETDLLFGKRIAKTSLRVAALGCVDEVNAVLGMARAGGGETEVIVLIDGIQERLVGLMGQLACLPEDLGRYKYVALTADDAMRAFGRAGELTKKFRSAGGVDYYGIGFESTREIE